VKLRIIGATPLDPTQPLCIACRRAMVRRDSRGQQEVFCRALGNRRVEAKITECSDYHAHDVPEIHEHEQLAWLWASGETGEPTFVRLRDLKTNEIAIPIQGFGW
jgi:hypothetical protein